MRISSGELITFVDADDWIEHNLFQQQVQTIMETGADIAACRFVKDYDENHSEAMWDFPSRRLNQMEALDCSSPYYFTAVGGKVYKRAVVENLAFDENIFYGEDTLFYTQALLNSKSVYWDRVPSYHYCANSNQATAQTNVSSLERSVTAFEAVMEICRLYKNLTPELYKGSICRAEQSASLIRNKMLLSGLYKRKEYRKKYRQIIKFIYTPQNLLWFFQWDVESTKSKIKRLFIYPILNWLRQHSTNQ